MDPAFIQNIHNLLQQTTAPDTNLIKAATNQLKSLYKDATCIPALFQILVTSDSPSIRQLAAVELRKRIIFKDGQQWQEVPQDVRETIKEKVVEFTFNEQTTSVRHSTARVIAAIAEIELPLGLWRTLVPLLVQATASTVVSQRETSVFILTVLLDKGATEFDEQVGEFFKLFSSLLQDPESLEVRILSVKALGSIGEYIEQDDKAAIRQYQDIVPAILTVVGQAVESSSEKNCREVFDVLETLLIIETPLLSKHVPALVQSLVQCAADKSRDEDIRNMILNALNWTVKYKRTKIQNNNLGGPIIDALFPIVTEPIPEDLDEEAPSRTALRIIDALAVNLPGSQVFPAMRGLMEKYMVSPEPSHRRAALDVLGTAVEGIADYLTQHMSDVWIVVDRGLADSDETVRSSACTTIGCLCHFCDEEVTARHAVLMPAILDLLGNPKTQKSAGVALDSILEILEDEVATYLNPIMERLVVLLDTAPTEIQTIIIGAIGSAAHSAGEKFLPYFEGTIQRLQRFLVAGDSAVETELKGITMDSLGTFARAVGKDAYRPYFNDVMKQAFLFLDQGNSRLAECSFILFGELAEVFGEEFAPFLPNVVRAILKSLKQSEGSFSDSLLNGALTETQEEGSSTLVVEEDVDVDEILKATSAICIEKQHSASVVGTIFVATKRHFLPYVEEVTLALIEQIKHFSEELREAAYDSLFASAQVFYQISEPAEWQPGLPVKVPLHQNVNDLIKHIMDNVVGAFEEDDDMQSVATLFVGLAESITEIGPGFVANHLEQIFKMVQLVLEQNAVCQKDPDLDKDEAVPMEQPEEQSALISAAGDVVAALASVLGEQFIEPLQTFLPLILKFGMEGRTATDRSGTVGCVGEIIGGMKGAITPFTEPLLQVLYSALADGDEQVRNNAAFAIGMLIENSDADLSNQYMTILGALQSYFIVPEGSKSILFNARDNACGSVAKMMIKNTDAIPLNQVLPVWFGSLPLKNDYLENRPVFRAIFHLLRHHSSDLGPYVDKILELFAFVLNPDGPDMLGDETRRAVLEQLAILDAQIPDKIQAAGLGVYLLS